MRILHTADWHIGKLVHGVHFTADQRYIFEQLFQLIDQHQPDVVVVAGDIYDRSVPPIEAVELLDEILSKILLELKTKVLIIAGNHDSPDRLGFASKILQDKGLSIIGKLSDTIKPVKLADQFGEVHFYAIPFTDYAVVRDLYQDKSITSHDLAMKAIVDKINAVKQPGIRTVCLAHGYITGTESLETSESERPLAIGGSEQVSVDYFKDFNYVALGHLHKAQKVKYEHIRYSGSLMKYSFSEAQHRKTVTMVDLDEAGKIEFNLIDLKPFRDLRIIKGNLDDLIDQKIYSLADTNDYIKAELTDRGEVIDAIGKLRAVYPNILKLEREQFSREAGDKRTSAGVNFFKKGALELFEEFYQNIAQEQFSDQKRDIIAAVLDEIEIEERKS